MPRTGRAWNFSTEPSMQKCRWCASIPFASLLVMIVIAARSLAAHGDVVALWLFDDPAGSPVAVDSSDNRHHLTIGPDAAIVPTGGKFGGALDADATPTDGLGAFRYRA